MRKQGARGAGAADAGHTWGQANNATLDNYLPMYCMLVNEPSATLQAQTRLCPLALMLKEVAVGGWEHAGREPCLTLDTQATGTRHPETNSLHSQSE